MSEGAMQRHLASDRLGFSGDGVAALGVRNAFRQKTARTCPPAALMHEALRLQAARTGKTPRIRRIAPRLRRGLQDLERPRRGSAIELDFARQAEDVSEPAAIHGGKHAFAAVQGGVEI